MKLLGIQSPQRPYYFVPLGPRCLPLHPILEHPQSMFYQKVEQYRRS